MPLSPEEINRIEKNILDMNIRDIGETLPKVSVIVPAYNTEKYIEKCLNSLIQQTIKDIEIIVVNDGSTDNTAEIAAIYSKLDRRVRLLHQEHLKQGIARNLGIKKANGEYIGYVDSDDWVDENYYEKLYNTAKKYSSDIAIATNIRIGMGKTKKRLNIKDETFVTTLQDKIDISRQVKNPCPTNKIYRKTLLTDHNILWPEGVFCEDKLYTIQALYYANGIVTVPDVNYYYYRNPSSTVNTKNNEHLENIKKDKKAARLAVIEFLREKNAKIRDCEFWAVTNENKFIVKKESIHTAKYLLFGIIPVWISKV